MKLITTTLLILGTISLNGFLTGYHHLVWDQTFEKCKADLIKAKNYQSVQQASECVHNSSRTVRILGTLLWLDN
jgi:hypothetical protein